MALQIGPGDLSDPRIVEMLVYHVEKAKEGHPPESCHALDVDELKAPDIHFRAAWQGDTLVGVGALKEWGDREGELKSMFVSLDARGTGAGAAMLGYLLDEARELGLRKVSLETGAWDYFIPARKLYEGFGFEVCEPFGTYKPDPISVFMTLSLDP